MDNRIFNVNGKTEEQLISALEYVFNQVIQFNPTCSSWKMNNKGLILYWHKEAGECFPGNVDLSAKEVVPFVKKWLSNAKPEDFDLDGWDVNLDHDGHNSIGWRIYCEDWGKVDDSPYAICAIKPVYLWHGK